MAFQTEQQREEQIAAELALYPQAEGYTYGAGFVGGHQSVGSWFTSGITGLILSKGASDNEQRNWYVQRTLKVRVLMSDGELLLKMSKVF